MFHIVFEKNSVAILNQAMDLDDGLDGEIVLFEDDYSLGPVGNLSDNEGRETRRQWWNLLPPHLTNEIKSDAVGQAEDHDVLQRLTERMQEESFDEIWIWVASNQQDVCGYYWLISQLSLFFGRVFILSLNNLPFLTEKGNVFYPSHLYDIPAREFRKAKRLARLVTQAEFEMDSEEWSKLVNQLMMIRTLEGAKKIQSQEADYYDAALRKFISGELQKPARFIHQFLAKSNTKVNDRFLSSRVREMIATGQLIEEAGSVKLRQTEAV